VAAAPAPVGEVDDHGEVVLVTGSGVEGEGLPLARVDHVEVGLAVVDVTDAAEAGDGDGVEAAGLDGHLARAEAGLERERAVGGGGEAADVLAARVHAVVVALFLVEEVAGGSLGPREVKGGLARGLGAGARGVRA